MTLSYHANIVLDKPFPTEVKQNNESEEWNEYTMHSYKT